MPAAFPRYPGSVLSTALAEPASAGYDVVAAAGTVAAFYRDALGRAGYATLGVDGPLEDGSVVIESSGTDADCRVRVTITPSGGITMVLVLFAAACPFS